MITSLQNNYIKQLRKLQKRKERESQQSFLVEGFHLVEEACLSDWYVSEIIIREGILLPAYCDNLSIIEVDEKVFKYISQTETPQGIAAVVKMKHSEEVKGDSVLLVDAVQDPGNLGTIVRTADAAGFSSIVIGKGTVDVFNDKVIRATQGSLFHISLINQDLHETIVSLKEKNYSIWATALKNATIYDELTHQKKVALIVGNEGEGVRSTLLELADRLVTIPIYGQAESLNVSVASGILMYYLNR